MPQGYFGEGHDLYHEQYKGLRNARGGSCCNGKDCRPTTARWNAETNTWDVMVDGQWRTLDQSDAYKVLSGALLEAQGRERPNAQAHVCAGRSGWIFCVIPPASGG